MRMGLVFLVLGLTASVAGSEERFVTPEAMSAWSIVCAPTATESERYAAGEFQSLFETMTSRKLTIVEKAPANGGAVFIGPEAVAQSGQSLPAVELGEEGLRIGVFDKCVCIDGGRPRGTLYGVYEFFEELCGVRYLTHDHTYIPENARSCKIPLGSRSYVPPFAFRWSYYGETMRYPAFAARLHTNTVSDDPKLGGRTGYRLVCHNVATLLPPAKYAATHPEYYALVDGHRTCQTCDDPQLCMTNPEIVDLVTQAILEEIKKNPTAKNVYIAQMDNKEYCACPNCAALDAREESHAASTLALVNAVAERVEKDHPDVLIGTFAYLYTRKPPKTMRARHNVMIQLCSIECCDYHAIDDADCPLNREFCADMAGWKAKAENVFIWHYNTNFGGYMLPFPNLKSIGRSVEYFLNNNGRGVFMQAAGNGFSTELSDLRNYVMSRCIWKPGRDSWKETEEFCRLHYRESSPAILEYLTGLHDRIGRLGTHPTCFPNEATLGSDQQWARDILAQFQKALAQAKSEEVRARVEKASLCAYRAALASVSMPLTVADGVCRLDLSGFEPGLFDRYAALCERYGVTMESELVPNAQYLGEYRKAVQGIPVVRLENETWRVTLLPELNGRFFEILYKPTGRNLVRNLRPLSRCRSEDWLKQGQGPSEKTIVPFEAQVQGDTAELGYTAPDGSRLVRRISLVGDAIRVEMQATAGAPRTFEFDVHPEYDAVSHAIDPKLVSVYVKTPQWTLANRDWGKPKPTTEDQRAALANAVAGGAYAYYQHEAGFGVEQRFDPQQFRALELYWNTNRRQINLELLTPAVSLEKGQQTSYSYEIRYLSKPPISE